MNRKIGLALVIVTASLLAAYYAVETRIGSAPDVALRDSDAGSAPDVTLRDSDAGSLTSPESQILDIPSGNNRFAINFYKEISDNDKNIFFSPVSMYVAFSALYEGARHDTAGQIQQVFGLESDIDVRHESIAQFMSHINQEDPYFTLKMVNALWLDDSFKIYDSYVDPAQDYYDVYVETLDLLNIGMEKINTWSAENTNDTINNVISPDTITKDTIMIITNAIYFAGEWLNQFPSELTRTGNFWKNSTENINVDFMRHEGLFHHASLTDVQLLKMPYKGDRLSMLVMLPNDRDGIESFEESLTIELVEQWKKEMRLTEINIQIPKFTMDVTYDLKTPLVNLGMIDVFDRDAADLSGIGISHVYPIFISKATQKAFVDINEIGTEAAAVTTIMVAQPVEATHRQYFIANHPFIFIIQDDETGAILFMGRLSDPTA